jgi:acyl carrier protein
VSGSDEMAGDGLTSLQKRVASVWADVLGTEEIPLDSHFYDLGGDSLAFVILLTRLNKAIGCNVEPGELFRRTTVRTQAELLAQSGAVQS